MGLRFSFNLFFWIICKRLLPHTKCYIIPQSTSLEATTRRKELVESKRGDILKSVEGMDGCFFLLSPLLGTGQMEHNIFNAEIKLMFPQHTPELMEIISDF